MFAYIDKTDKTLKNITHRNYFLTQGDSFSLTARPVNGEIELIDKLVFKIGTQNEDGSLNEMYSQDYVLNTDDIYYLGIKAETTTEWEITENVGEPYIYEIEVHYVDGGINTIEQSEFTVWSQIRR